MGSHLPPSTPPTPTTPSTPSTPSTASSSPCASFALITPRDSVVLRPSSPRFSSSHVLPFALPVPECEASSLDTRQAEQTESDNGQINNGQINTGLGIHYATFQDFEAACQKKYDEAYLPRLGSAIDLASLGRPVAAHADRIDADEDEDEDEMKEDEGDASCSTHSACARRWSNDSLMGSIQEDEEDDEPEGEEESDRNGPGGSEGPGSDDHFLSFAYTARKPEAGDGCRLIEGVSDKGMRRFLRDRAMARQERSRQYQYIPEDRPAILQDLEHQIWEHTQDDPDVVYDYAFLHVEDHEENQYEIKHEPHTRRVLYRAPIFQTWSSIALHGVIPHVVVNADIEESHYVDTPLETKGDKGELVPAEYERLLGPGHPIASGRIRTPPIELTYSTPPRSKPFEITESSIRKPPVPEMLEPGTESNPIILGRDTIAFPPSSSLIHANTTPARYRIGHFKPQPAGCTSAETRRLNIVRDEAMVRHAPKALQVRNLPATPLAPGWAIKKKADARAGVTVHDTSETTVGCGTTMIWEKERERVGRWLQIQREV